MNKITLITFTDPMMRLSYEQEPVYEKLSIQYKEQLEFKYVMAGLVYNVRDFMTAEELSLPLEEGIQRYNQRLALIYKNEESIGDLPIHMEGFHLFDVNHQSSYPLCIAYKAAQFADPEKSEEFLFRLRRATIVEARQTTSLKELAAVAKEVKIDVKLFIKYFHSQKVLEAFKEDLKLTRSLHIQSLPMCLIQYKNKRKMINGLSKYEDFKTMIDNLITDNDN